MTGREIYGGAAPPPRPPLPTPGYHHHHHHVIIITHQQTVKLSNFKKLGLGKKLGKSAADGMAVTGVPCSDSRSEQFPLVLWRITRQPSVLLLFACS